MKNFIALLALMMLCFIGVTKGNAPPGIELTGPAVTVFIAADVQPAGMAIQVQSYFADVPFVLKISPTISVNLYDANVAAVQISKDVYEVSNYCNLPTPDARDAVLNGIDQLPLFSCTLKRNLLLSKLIRSMEPFDAYWQFTT